jgi:hypothetical protein
MLIVLTLSPIPGPGRSELDNVRLLCFHQTINRHAQQMTESYAALVSSQHSLPMWLADVLSAMLHSYMFTSQSSMRHFAFCDA